MAALPETRAYIEIQRHSTDQEPRRQPALLQYPGQHARCRGFAMRARDTHDPAALQDVACPPFRAGLVSAPTVQQRFDQLIATAHDVTNHEHIRVQRQLVRRVSLDDVDAQTGKLRAHRRVDADVGPGHAMPGRTRQRGDPAHEGSADSNNMQVHFSPPRLETFQIA